MAPRNFVLLFREREGSSAIIDLLGNHPQLRVPVFEQLDQHEAKKYCDRKDIARLVGLTYATGDLARARKLLKSGAPPGPPLEQGVGFKWRIWGPPDEIAQMLVERQVVVFHLFRLKLLELVASVIFSNTVIPELERAGADLLGGGHLQFKMAAMSPEQRDAFRQRLAEIHFRIDPIEFLALARGVVVFKRRMHDLFLAPLQRQGVEVRSLIYEDFVGNRHAFLQSMCKVIGVDPTPLRTAEPFYKKVLKTTLAAQVENWAEVSQQPELREVMADYRSIIIKDHTYLPPATAR